MRKALTIFAAGATLTAARELDHKRQGRADRQRTSRSCRTMHRRNLGADTRQRDISNGQRQPACRHDRVVHGCLGRRLLQLWADTWFALGELDRRVELERESRVAGSTWSSRP